METNIKEEFEPEYFTYKGKMYHTSGYRAWMVRDQMKQQDGSWADVISYNPVSHFKEVEGDREIYKVEYSIRYLRSVEDFMSKFESLSEEQHKHINENCLY